MLWVWFMKQPRLFIGLRLKLFIAFALVALAPLLFLAVVNGRQVRHTLIQDANRSLFLVATQTAATLDEFIDGVLADLIIDSHAPAVSAYFALPPTERLASPEEQRLRTFLTTLTAEDEYVRSFALLNADGENVLDSHAPYQGQSEAVRDYFQHFQETADNLPFASAVQHRPNVETALLFFAIPISADNGERLGYLRAEYEAAVLQAILAAQNGLAGQDSFAVLLDENNNQLAHGLGATAATNSSINQAMAVASLRTQPWVVAIQQPQEMFLAPMEAQTRQTATLVAVIAGTAVLAAYLFGGILTRTEESWQQQRRFLHQVMDMNPSFIFAKDRDGRFVMVNQAFANTYRTTIKNMLGKTDADFNPNPDQVEQFRRDDLQVFQSGEEVFIPEQRSVSPAGNERWWQTIKRPIRAEDGSVSEVLTVVTEITQRKETEEALRVARDQALEASRIKSEILAKAHHELQTPLGAILGYAEMIEMGYFGNVSDMQKETLQKIINRTNHLTALVQDLLAQANLESRKITFHQSYITPSELLLEMHQVLDEAAAVKGLTLTSEIEANFPAVIHSDRKRLMKILTSLVGNSIKFTERGQVHVRLYQPDETTWAMAVSDSGPGIPKEARAYIFEPFRQVDGSLTRKHQGFGLGLSLVKELVLSLEGEVHLSSEAGEGSTFTVILPYTPIMEAIP
jgi:PAS domain S-box-containing protein